MGIKFYGGVHLPTLRFGPRYPQLGRTIFEAENLMSKIVVSSKDTSATVTDITGFTEDTIRANSTYDAATLTFNVSSKDTSATVTNITGETTEPVLSNTYYDGTTTFTANVISNTNSVDNVEGYTDETILTNTYYDATTVTF